jgi:hypothetical protein
MLDGQIVEHAKSVHVRHFDGLARWAYAGEESPEDVFLDRLPKVRAAEGAEIEDPVCVCHAGLDGLMPIREGGEQAGKHAREPFPTGALAVIRGVSRVEVRGSFRVG